MVASSVSVSADGKGGGMMVRGRRDRREVEGRLQMEANKRQLEANLLVWLRSLRSFVLILDLLFIYQSV